MMRRLPALSVAALVLLSCSPSLAEPQGGWTSAGALPPGLNAPSLTLLADGSVLAVGFGDAATHTVPTAIFDPRRREWAAAPAIPQFVARPAITVLRSGVVLAAGGFDLAGVPVDRTYEFDPLHPGWLPAAPMPRPTALASSVPLADGRVLVSGGVDAAGPPDTAPAEARAELFDPVAGRWTEAAPMANPRTLHSSVVVDGRALVFGGLDGDRVMDSVEAYDPAADRWSPEPPMPQPRYGGFAMADGRRVIVGGGSALDQPGTYSNTPQLALDLYDLGDRRWRVSSIPLVSDRTREETSIALLPDGRIFTMLSGVSGPQFYDPAANTWLPAAVSPLSGDVVPAVGLADGRVLAVGGSASAIFDSRSTPSPPPPSSFLDSEAATLWLALIALVVLAALAAARGREASTQPLT